jgi:OOP family OmpA-OmpF porin
MLKINSNTIIGLFVVAALTFSSLAMAAQDTRWYFIPALSYILADSDRRADDDFGVQLGVGRPINQWWNMELSGVVDTLDYENNAGEFKQRGALLDGLYFFGRSERFSPYAVVGAGALRSRIPGDTDTNPMLNVGVGAMSQLGTADVRLRGDIRYRWDDDDRIAGQRQFGDWIITIGLAIPFGGAEKAAVPAAAAARQAQMMDRDGDGIADNNDRCPNTAVGAKVNASGCENDSDNDGIVDRLDRCDATPAGAKVDAKGCELDSDADGIKDSADACPDSKVGTSVDNRGCELAAVIVLKGVRFATDSATLTEDSMDNLDDIAATLRRYPNMVVEVAGYTDNQGAVSYNVQLSQDRANSVVNHLVGKGANPANLKAKGYGPENPVADNNTAEGRQQNRRVEMHILKR